MVFFVKMLLRLLTQFVPVDDEDLPRILGKAKNWAMTIRTDDEADNTTPEHWKKIAKILDMWGVQLGILFVYLFAYDALQNMFREGKTKDDDDDKI